MAQVLPFPRVRDRRFVLKHARRMADLAEKTAERHLAYQLQVQADTMTRRGIAPELIAQQIRALELAIRAEVWRLVLTPGDTA